MAPDAFQELLAFVLPLLASGGADWMAKLTGLVTKYGAEAIDCVVKHAAALTVPGTPPSPHRMHAAAEASPAMASYRAAGLKIGERARIWLSRAQPARGGAQGGGK
jgi:hypothetical protein